MSILLAGCQQMELENPKDDSRQPLKTVTISAEIDSSDETKASLDSETGQFAWQNGDQISVLATDGKFYTFSLSSGNGEHFAEFSGSIPETAQITSVAMHPAIMENGADNTVFSNGTLKYSLPDAYEHIKNSTNVPMVAVFEEGASDMSFKQIGGVMRFPVKNMPAKASFCVTMKNKIVTGAFSVNTGKLGSAAIAAGEGESVVNIAYNSEVDGADAVINLPVPTGTYNNFNVTVKDELGNTIFAKDYSKDNKVNRATLLIMSELNIPEYPMTINEVWPFFSDAKVFWTANANADGYAIYIDEASEPFTTVGADATEAFFGGDFDVNTTHKVQVAIIKDGEVVEGTKSAAYEFTTGNIQQRKVNAGPTHVCVEWDDVSAGKSATRGYHFELYASDNLEQDPIYSLYTYDTQATYGSTLSSSSWLGAGGSNGIYPTAVSMGFLEPDKTYYFRIRTLREGESYLPTYEQGNIYGNCKTPMTSARPGDKYSKLIPLTTEAKHVAETNEVLFEGFDDITLQGDHMNTAVGVTPLLTKIAAAKGLSANYTNSKTLYQNNSIVDAYTDFLALEHSDREWVVTGYNTLLMANQLCMRDYDAGTVNVNGGSIAGWAYAQDDGMEPGYGYIRIGKNNSNPASISTYALNSPYLSTTPVWCEVSLKMCPINMKDADLANKMIFGRLSYNSETGVYEDVWSSDVIEVEHEREYTSSSNYRNIYKWYEVKVRVPLAMGDKLKIVKAGAAGTANEMGRIGIDDVKIIATSELYTTGSDDSGETETDNLPVSEPDGNVNYDVYGMGELPISFWWAPPTSAHNYDPDKTLEIYRTMKESGINIINYFSHSADMSLTENKRILNIAEELGMKYISYTDGYDGDHAGRIAAIKENYSSSSAYIGEHYSDEPSADEFDDIASFVNAFRSELPDHDVYVNLYPSYASSGALGTSSYEEHLDLWLEKGNVKNISFDHYCLLNNGSVTAVYFQNLDIVRNKTLAAKKPFWFITQAGQATINTRVPNEQEERWSVWTALALGSKGIQYFCYWTPTTDANVVGTYMIDADGNKTDMYNWVKQINSDINTIGKKLLYCHADGGIMTHTTYFPLWDNDGKGRSHYGPITGVDGSNSILCGCFRDARTSENGDNYKGYKALVVSEMPNRSVDAYINLESGISEITFTHNNTTSTFKLTNELDSKVGEIGVAYDGARLTLAIPDGEAVLLEF